jgi:hypothetical protein
VSTDKGSDILFKKMGLSRVIGTNFVPTDLESARQKFIEAIDQDARVSSVRRLDFEDGAPADAVIIDADVEIRGFTEAANIQSTV